MQTVAQLVVIVKDEVSEAWRFGFEDGLNGLSVYTGCNYFTFASPQWKQYEAGWSEGRKVAAHWALMRAQVMPDDFAGALADVAEHGIRYCPPGIDWAAVEDEGVGA